jgi:hypothetical protein
MLNEAAKGFDFIDIMDVGYACPIWRRRSPGA